MVAFHHLMVALAGLSTSRQGTGHTIYVTQINNHEVVCSYVERDKGCYNLQKCYDGNSYLCVQNVEITIDK